MSPVVSIISVNHNGGPLICELVKSILEGTYGDIEIIVVDNGSTDNSIEKLQTEYHESSILTVLHLKSNEPLTKALNFGIMRSSGEFVAILHNDVRVTETWLEECIDTIMESPDIAAVQGKIYDQKSKLIDTCGCIVDFHGCEHDRGMGELDHGQFDTDSSIFSASGVASLFRKKAIIAVGLFDETYSSGLDDLDLCWRLRLSGHKIAYTPKAIAFHLRSMTWRSSPILELFVKFEFAKTRLYVPFKNFETLSFMRNLPVILLHTAGGFFLEITTPRSSMEYLKGLVWFIRNIGELSAERTRVQSKVRKISDAEVFANSPKTCNLVKYYIGPRLSTKI